MANKEVLDSWKQIAAYLSRSVKTCRRWEHELGLPVHRLEESPKARVFAYPDELDQWIKSIQKSDEIQFKKRRLYKNKSLIYILGAVIIIVVFILGFILLTKKKTALLDSIAILPIVNDSGDPSQDYFANSLTTLLISEMHKVSALNVAPPESVRIYKNSKKNPKEIARELNVKAIVQASVFQVGNKIRLIATLSDPFQNKIIWSDKLERDCSEILILQSELSQAIVNGINVAITPEEKTRLITALKVNPKAYDVFLKGVERYDAIIGFEKSLLNNFLIALDYFQSSIEIDPKFALAHAWKAHTLDQLGAEGFVNPKEVFPKAREAALKALELDYNLAEAHRTLGLIKMDLNWDFQGALNEMKIAYDLKPGSRMTKTLYTRMLAWAGRTDEAIALHRHHIEQQEKSQPQKKYYLDDAMSFLFFGLYKEGLEVQKNVIESLSWGPDWVSIRLLAVAYVLNGMYSEALAQLDRIKDLPGTKEDHYFLLDHAWILALSGLREEAMNKFEELKALLASRNIDTTYYTACFYAGLGEKDKAFEYLYRAYDNRSPMITLLLTDWWLHSLKSDPRFEVLVKKIGFPAYTKKGK